MLNRILVTALLLGGITATSPAIAAVDVGVSGSGCFSIVSDLRRNWIELKRFLLPGTENLLSPDDDDFVCVSRYATERAFEKHTSMGSTVRCFRSTQFSAAGFCCDGRLSECAMLNPALFPDAWESGQQEEEYEPPKSGWVRPPSESEQWKSN